MGETTADVGCGLVIEAGLPRWQLWVSQSIPARHDLLDVTATEYDALRIAARAAGETGVLDVLAGIAGGMTWWSAIQLAEQDAIVVALAMSPPSHAWG